MSFAMIWFDSSFLCASVMHVEAMPAPYLHALLHTHCIFKLWTVMDAWMPLCVCMKRPVLCLGIQKLFHIYYKQMCIFKKKILLLFKYILNDAIIKSCLIKWINSRWDGHLFFKFAIEFNCRKEFKKKYLFFTFLRCLLWTNCSNVNSFFNK